MRLPLVKAISWIVGSTVLISGSAFLLLRSYRAKVAARLSNPHYHISLIVQTGLEKNALPTQYLAELMGLSCDQPTNLYGFSPKRACKTLLASPLIASAHVCPIKPGAIYVDYTVRQPLFRLAEYANTGVDADGVIIPLEPYLSPKRLPELVLNVPLEDPVWGERVDVELPKRLLQTCPLTIKRVDLSDIHADSAGRRQLILIVEDPTERILRLAPKHYEEQLCQYEQLRLEMTEDIKVIDFRIEDMAFMYS